MIVLSNWCHEQGWMLTLISSCLCLLGCMVIFIDNIYYLVVPKFISRRYKFRLEENYSILNGSLSFSAGCLLFTALARLLPESSNYIYEALSESEDDGRNIERQTSFTVTMGYVGGALLYVLFNGILHVLTSESVVHCNHSNGEEGHSHHHMGHADNSRQPDIEESIQYSPMTDISAPIFSNGDGVGPIGSARKIAPADEESAWEAPHDTIDTENTPLINNESGIPHNASKKSLFHLISSHSTNEMAIGECKGYSSAEACLFHDHNTMNTHELHSCEIPTLVRDHHHHHHHLSSNSSESISSRTCLKSNNESGHDIESHNKTHHHHVTSPFSRLFLIGIQTTLAITLHKLPEGFITFVTSQTNPQLGFSIFLSLTVHNFTEGFSMCLPLFYSFSSSKKKYPKVKAIAVSGTLGAFSQPLGAFLGYLFLAYNDSKFTHGDARVLNHIFGITLAVTSGFLSVIALTMYGSAISFGGSINNSMLLCVLGCSVIGVASIYSS